MRRLAFASLFVLLLAVPYAALANHGSSNVGGHWGCTIRVYHPEDYGENVSALVTAVCEPRDYDRTIDSRLYFNIVGWPDSSEDRRRVSINHDGGTYSWRLSCTITYRAHGNHEWYGWAAIRREGGLLNGSVNGPRLYDSNAHC